MCFKARHRANIVNVWSHAATHITFAFTLTLTLSFSRSVSIIFSLPRFFFPYDVIFTAGFYLIRWCFDIVWCWYTWVHRVVPHHQPPASCYCFFKWLRIDVLFMVNIVMHSTYIVRCHGTYLIGVGVLLFNKHVHNVCIHAYKLSSYSVPSHNAYQTIATISENNIILKHTLLNYLCDCCYTNNLTMFSLGNTTYSLLFTKEFTKGLGIAPSRLLQFSSNFLLCIFNETQIIITCIKFTLDITITGKYVWNTKQGTP